MSAICGIFNLAGRPVAPETIDGMLAAMDYWGPDGSGVWMDGPVAMGPCSIPPPNQWAMRCPGSAQTGT